MITMRQLLLERGIPLSDVDRVESIVDSVAIALAENVEAKDKDVPVVFNAIIEYHRAVKDSKMGIHYHGFGRV